MRGQVSDFAWLGHGLFMRCGSRILRGFDGKSRAGVPLFVIWYLGYRDGAIRASRLRYFGMAITQEKPPSHALPPPREKQ